MLGQGLDKIFSEISDSFNDGDLGVKRKIESLSNTSTIARVISNRLDGISPVLVELLIAITAKD
jgi:hypothetical protein